jgi:hypothetical protein
MESLGKLYTNLMANWLFLQAAIPDRGQMSRTLRITVCRAVPFSYQVIPNEIHHAARAQVSGHSASRRTLRIVDDAKSASSCTRAGANIHCSRRRRYI